MVEQFFIFLQTLITRIIIIRPRDESRQLRARAAQFLQTHRECFVLPGGESVQFVTKLQDTFVHFDYTVW